MLAGRIKVGAGVELVTVESLTKPRLSIVVVHYSLRGKEQPYGLRLDLDKQVFLDHIEDPKADKAIQHSVPQIVEYLSSSNLWEDDSEDEFADEEL